ncbi:MAG: trypsin-like peptidase domain-containing protein [Clostridia bacterium]|nr:trypsin-like peptidase domain-containing protein [Clostridia bacterium]
MENNYYQNAENQNFYGKSKKKNDRALSYIVTGLIAFIIGFVLAFVMRLSFTSLKEVLPPVVTASPSAEPTTEIGTPDVSGSASATPSTTYIAPSVEFDGKAPVITDQVNPIPEIVEQLAPGIVGILNYGYSDEYESELEQGSGTGFVISTNGYILTNAHIVEDADRITVLLSGDEEIEAEVLGMDKSSDVAVIKVDPKYTGTALKIGDSENVRVGEFVIAIGDPTGRELAGTTTFGIISAAIRTVNIEGRTNEYIQTDAAINPGSSGGPLLNMKGEVIGIASAKTVTASYDEYGNAISAEGLGFAIPMHNAMKIVDQLILQGKIERPGIGVSVSTVNEVQSKYYTIPEGVLVVTVTKDGMGHEAGVRVGDIILSCNGEKLHDQERFVELVQSCSVGDKLMLEVWRNGETLDITVTVGDLNEMGSETIEEEFSFERFE